MRKLLGNYLVFMSSTVNGYEGTVTDINLRSVEMKLLSGEMALIPYVNR